MSNIYNLLPLQRRIDKLNSDLRDFHHRAGDLKKEQHTLERRIKDADARRKEILNERNHLTAALRVLKEDEE